MTQKVLGAAGGQIHGFFEDPNKMLQMILAAESHASSGGGGGGGMGGPGTARAGGAEDSDWRGGVQARELEALAVQGAVGRR